MINHFANPARFFHLAVRLEPLLGGMTLVLLVGGIYFAIFASPPDYQQGESVRIMYVHVPAAWIGMAAYSSLAAFSFIALVWRHPLADLMARSVSPIGASFTFLCLLTGSLWGKPMWGTWWVWDARLTSMLILLLLYLGHMALLNAFDEPMRGARAGAILAIAGFINVPIIKFSVDWWHTLHQPASITRFGMPRIDPAMLLPLLLMGAGYTLFFLTLLLVKTRVGILGARIRGLRIAQYRESK